MPVFKVREIRMEIWLSEKIVEAENYREAIKETYDSDWDYEECQETTLVKLEVAEIDEETEEETIVYKE